MPDKLAATSAGSSKAPEQAFSSPSAPPDPPHAARPSSPSEGWWEKLTGISHAELRSRWNALRGDPYPLDARDRFLEEGETLECNADALVRYEGTHLDYAPSVRVRPVFTERLVRFEQLVSRLSIEVYGRAPRRVRHFGAYSCRANRNRALRISEHALGNAIDVSGFDFGPLPPAADALGLPSALHRAFQVRVSRHWHGGDDKVSATHSHFLHQIAARLRERKNIFRVMIGPSRTDHADHFHFDMSPWRYVRF